MQIEITGETERLIQAALATGQLDSVDELLATLARQLPSHRLIGQLPDLIDIDKLATEQGVGVYHADHRVPPDLWPEDESVDDFVGCVRTAARRSAASRIR